MKRINIRYPIWKTNSVGIAEYKIDDDIEVEIEYKLMDGKKLYPNHYQMSKDKALSYPTQVAKRDVVLRIIPIKDFEEVLI